MKDAEEWADKELNSWIDPEHYQVHKDFTELLMFGRIGYRLDKEGNKTRLTQQELFGLESNPDTTVSTFNSMEEYSEYLKSVK